MHLAVVTPFPPAATSIGQYGYCVTEALARSGAFERITVLTETVSDIQSIEARNGIRVERVWQRDSLKASWKIVNRLSQLSPDLLWYNLGASIFGRSSLVNLCGLLAPTLSHMIQLPSVVTMHEMVEQADLRALRSPGGSCAIWGARLITILISQADVVCVTLQRHADQFSLRHPNVHVVHIPLGVFNSPHPLADPDDLELLMLAHFAPFKGLELLLAAFRGLRSRYPSLRLTMAGTEHPRFPGYLNRVRQTFGEQPDVTWLNCVPEAQLQSLFARATVVVLPYIATTGSSSALHRAAGWGRPIVASDLPEMRAIAEEEQLWIEFFPSNSLSGLVSTLDRLLANPKRRAAQASHNYCAVVRSLTLAHTCEAYLHAFDLALATRNRETRISTLPETTTKNL